MTLANTPRRNSIFRRIRDRRNLGEASFLRSVSEILRKLIRFSKLFTANLLFEICRFIYFIQIIKIFRNLENTLYSSYIVSIVRTYEDCY